MIYTLKWVAAATTMCLAASGAWAQSASGGRALGAVGKTLSDMAARQDAIDAEVEIARRKAEIELEYQRRLRALDRPAAPPQTAAPASAEVEEAALTKTHPQWERIVSSTAFDSWLETQSPVFSMTCRTTQRAQVLATCIDTFFGPPVPPKRR